MGHRHKYGDLMKPPFNYKACTTVSLLHHAKRAYQYNMLKSLALTLVLPAVLAVCLLLFSGKTSKVKIDLRNASMVTVPKAASEGMVISKVESPGPSGISKNNISGGFKGYTIVKDRVSPNLSVPVLSVVPDEISIEHFDLSTFSNNSGDVYGINIDWMIEGNGGSNRAPANETMNIKQGTWEIPDREERFSLKNSIQVDEWATVKIDKYLKRPRYPKKGNCKGGVAKIGVTIDKKGNIIRMEVLCDRPEGHDFAKALKE